jgi:cell wall-associated NlpC family hydrolase
MALSEPLRITLLVARALEQLEVPYLLGGSLASSLKLTSVFSRGCSQP